MTSYLRVGSQFVGLATMLVYAIQWEYLLTLLFTGIVSAPIHTIGKHLFCKDPKKRLCWNQNSKKEIVHFCKWMCFSGVSTFITSRLDLCIMWLCITKLELGYYALASAGIYIVVDNLSEISGKILIPLYSNLKRYIAEKMRSKAFLLAIALVVLTMPPLYGASIYAQYVAYLAYPQQQYDAWWMLQILAIGSTLKSIKTMIDPVLLTVGDSFKIMALQMSQTIKQYCL